MISLMMLRVGEGAFVCRGSFTAIQNQSKNINKFFAFNYFILFVCSRWDEGYIWMRVVEGVDRGVVVVLFWKH